MAIDPSCVGLLHLQGPLPCGKSFNNQAGSMLANSRVQGLNQLEVESFEQGFLKIKTS